MNEQNNFNEIIIDDTIYQTKLTKKYSFRKVYKPADKSVIRAFIPGTIRKIYVSVGQSLQRGDKILVLEAMKMNNDIITPVNAVIKAINVREEEVVVKNQVLVELELKT